MLGGPDWSQLHAAMRMIDAEGRGLVVMIRDTGSTAISERVRRISGSRRPAQALRDYGIGAQILLDLGVHADGAAVQHAAAHRGHGRLRHRHRRPAPDRSARPIWVRMSTADAPLPSAAPGSTARPPHRARRARALLQATWSDGLTDGAERVLREAGATFDTLDVAGAFELPQAIRLALRGTISGSTAIVAHRLHRARRHRPLRVHLRADAWPG